MIRPSKIIIAALLFSSAFYTNTFAQQLNVPAETAYTGNRSGLLSDHTRSVEPSPKTGASFATLFPNAVNTTWAIINDNCFYVSFLNSGRKANASFTANGKMNYCITDCSMENLPTSFREAIKKKYSSYSLLKGTEIKAYGNIAYQAILESPTGYKTLKYTRDGIEEIDSVKK